MSGKRLQSYITAPSSQSAGASSTTPAARPVRGQSVRQHCMDRILEQYPGFKPRGDIDIWLLGMGHYDGPNSEAAIHEYIDKELAITVELTGDFDEVVKQASKALKPVVEVTGTKPKKGKPTPPGVFVRPIPGSEYSIRLFPGAFARKEYCLDFVKTDTGEAVNSPFRFELWGWPGNTAHCLPAMRMTSLESTFGKLTGKLKDMKPGSEKFVLRDGKTCVLKRPGYKNVRFSVPVRVDSSRTAAASESDDIHLEFPAEVRV